MFSSNRILMSSVANGFKALADKFVPVLDKCAPLRLSEGELNFVTGEVERLEETRRASPSIGGRISIMKVYWQCKSNSFTPK